MNLISALVGGSALVLVAAPLAFGGTNPGVASAAPRDGLECAFETSKVAGGVKIEAVVETTKPAEGAYRLQLLKTSQGGTSAVTQGGAFSAAPGERVVLGTVMLDSGTIEATLSVTSNRGNHNCAFES